MIVFEAFSEPLNAIYELKLMCDSVMLSLMLIYTEQYS